MFKFNKTSTEFDIQINIIEDEIKELNEIKAVILSRVYVDRDYANKLKPTIGKKLTILEGLSFENCWNKMQEQVKDVNNSILESCTILENETIPKLAAIVKEKSEAKQRLIEEKRKYDKSLNILKNELDSARTEYCKAIAKLMQADKKEKLLVNFGSRVHIAHNSYLLALKKYKNQETILNNKIRPKMMFSHFEIQETLLEELKVIFAQYFRHINFIKPGSRERISFVEDEIALCKPANDYKENISKILNNIEHDFANQFNIDVAVSDANRIVEPALHSNSFSITSVTFFGLKKEKNALILCIEDCDKKIKEIRAEYMPLQNEIDRTGSLSAKVRLIEVTRETTELETKRDSLQLIMDQLFDIPAYNENLPDIRLKPQPKSVFYEVGLGFNKIVTPTQPMLVPESPPGIFNQEPVVFNHSLELEDQPWFHGILPRTEVEENLLNSEGEFLVRESNNQNKNDRCGATSYVVSLCVTKNPKRCQHCIIYQNPSSKKYLVETDIEFDKISQMLQYYVYEKTNNFSNGNVNKFIKPVLRKSWAIRDSDLKIIKEIDSGNYGIVFLGQYKNKPVAIKSLKKPPGLISVPTDNLEKTKLLAEGKLLEKYNHKNIVRFIGIAIDTDPIKIVMEYVEGGSLKKYLESNRNISIEQMLKFCDQCASGMQYLEQNRVIHRDLAARNCLLTRDLQLKITDFGLSKQLEDDENSYTMSCMRPIPVRWTAPESFKGVFSSKSDVWSFGITAWEIFSNGLSPYGEYDTSAIRGVVLSGRKLNCPSGINASIYHELLEPCWNMEPWYRPDFTQLLATIASLFERIHYLK